MFHVEIICTNAVVETGGGILPPQFSPGNFTIYQEKRDKEGKWRGKEGKFEREEVEN